jgi:hypothetical protein
LVFWFQDLRTKFDLRLKDFTDTNLLPVPLDKMEPADVQNRKTVLDNMQKLSQKQGWLHSSMRAGHGPGAVVGQPSVEAKEAPAGRVFGAQFVFHGCSLEAARAISRSGFKSLSTTDGVRCVLWPLICYHATNKTQNTTPTTRACRAGTAKGCI